MNKLLRGLLTSLVIGISGATSAASPPRVQPDNTLPAIGKNDAGFGTDLKKKKQLQLRQSVSGVACALNAKDERVCLLAFDEGSQGYFARLDGTMLTPLKKPVTLISGDGELDAEAAATDGRYFYIAGSHSPRRSDCSARPDSRHIVRLARDPETGRALKPGRLKGAIHQVMDPSAPEGYADSTRLWTIMQAQPELAAHVTDSQCMGDQGAVNIEGMAVRDGRLTFGFRGPVADGAAKLLSVDADALFDPTHRADPKAVFSTVALGAHTGIRDMVAVTGGFLLLAGPDDERASQKTVDFSVWFWDGRQAPGQPGTARALATLDTRQINLRSCDKEIKLEALTVLQETAFGYQVLVLSDGLCDGGALVFTVGR
ncbi:MAG: DUF3616 domain-containing protein [Polaromonas sp.]|nr:DUF3616 domain-containing protein [Polaromonas sp.]